MTVVTVSDSADPRLTLYRGVSDAALLRTERLFVAEGRLVVERVLADRRYHVESLLINDASLAALERALAARAADVPIFRCEAAVFEGITGFNIHRGCLALVRRPPTLTWREAVGDSRLIVVLEGVTNADNVGGVFRNAAAFGAGAVLLSPTCCDPLYRKAIRTSMAAVLSVPFARMEPWPSVLKDVRAEGCEIVALSPRAPGTVEAFVAGSAHDRVALLVGTEGGGLTRAAEEEADVLLRIPIRGAVDSLNLSVATGSALCQFDSHEDTSDVASSSLLGRWRSK